MSSTPSPARVRRAWQAGVRASSAWLPSGLGCLALAWWIAAGAAAPGALGEGAHASLRAPSLAQAAAWSREIAWGAVVVLGVIAVLLAIAALVGAAALGRLGPVQPAQARGLGMAAVPTRMRVGVGLGALMIGALLFDVQRRIAGAARAADASLDGLQALWQGSVVASLVAIGTAMVAIGALEAWQHRRDQRHALVPTAEQAADEARRGRGRRP